MVNGTLNIYSELHKIRPIRRPCPELREIHALRAHFSRFCIPSGKKIAKICAIRILFNSLQISHESPYWK